MIFKICNIKKGIGIKSQKTMQTNTDLKENLGGAEGHLPLHFERWGAEPIHFYCKATDYKLLVSCTGKTTKSMRAGGRLLLLFLRYYYIIIHHYKTSNLTNNTKLS